MQLGLHLKDGLSRCDCPAPDELQEMRRRVQTCNRNLADAAAVPSLQRQPQCVTQGKRRRPVIARTAARRSVAELGGREAGSGGQL
jgi:aminoglycoside phosphotransferase (APT) family kinase protein